MLSTQLSQLAIQNDWQINAKDDLVYGDFNKFRFTLMEGIGFKAILTPVAGISSEGLVTIKAWLRANQKPLNLKNYSLADNFLVVRLRESWKPRSTEQLAAILTQLSDVLKQIELPLEACAICGQPAEKQGLLHGLYCAMHLECQDTKTVDFTATHT
ncbi:MAG: hypothetical protein PHC86_07630 [Eubacteriales bacterium]|nr:hypothetical protein [Eubacteriales bacterium]